MRIITIGGSLGSLPSILDLMAELPAGFPAAILIVWHISSDAEGILPKLINQHSMLKAKHATDGEAPRAGQIYVAPPDHHMVFYDGKIRITYGPKENRFRPAIDPLFRSAALAFGPAVIGIVLSGGLDDGSSGLWSIKTHGGIAIVQDPAEAEIPSMPQSAIEQVSVDYCVPVTKMGQLLNELVELGHSGQDHAPADVSEREHLENAVIMMQPPPAGQVRQFGSLTPFTCPECNGVLSTIEENGKVRFRCHTGHAYTAEALARGISTGLEERLWGVVREGEEKLMLMNHLGDYFSELNHPVVAARYFQQARMDQEWIEKMRLLLGEPEQKS